MKQLVVALAVLIAVVAGVSWATSRSSSAQEQDSPTEPTVPDEGAEPLNDLSLDEFVECLGDQGIEVPDVEQGEGRFGFHFDFDIEDLEALKDAYEACGDAFPLGKGVLPFGGRFFGGDEFPFEFGGPFTDFGLGGALDLGALAECLSELGTFENVDEVRAQLEECLPAPIDFESWLQENGIDGRGFPFGGRDGFGFFDGPGHFGFDFDFDWDGESELDDPVLEDSPLEGAAA